MSLEADFLGAFEEHSPEGIRHALAAGASATKPIKRYRERLAVRNVPNKYLAPKQ
jgi:hypothetical protein